MPKDITKASLKELDLVGEGELEQRMRWHDGGLELSVPQGGEEDDED